MLDIIIDNPDYSYQAYYVLASLYFDNSEFDAARDICLDGLNFHEQSYRLYYKISACYNELTTYEDAKINAEKALKIKKKFAPASFELGIAWMNLCDEYEAIKAFKQSSKDRSFKKESKKYLDSELEKFIKKNCN